jgi:hypothetical protein
MKVAAKRIGISFDEYLNKTHQGLKWCWDCASWQSVTEFSIDRHRGDGLSSRCHQCRRINKNKPGKRERAAMKDRGFKWCCNCKQWFPEKEIHGARCRPCRNIYARERYAQNAQYREGRKNHRDKQRRGVERVPVIGQQVLLENSGGLCVYCGAPANTWDHIVPVSKGGKTTPGNIVPACSHCNSSKKDRDVLEWIDLTGRKPLDLLCSRLELSAME